MPGLSSRVGAELSRQEPSKVMAAAIPLLDVLIMSHYCPFFARSFPFCFMILDSRLIKWTLSAHMKSVLYHSLLILQSEQIELRTPDPTFTRHFALMIIDDLTATSTATCATTHMDPLLSPEASSAPRLPATSALECRLCDVTFPSAEEKRQHAKSEWQ
jgi:hypothetical protein